jgi:DNA polymerase III epsilon subunit-like protein
MPILVFDCETTGLPIEKTDKKLKYTSQRYHHPKKTKYYDTSRLVELGFGSISKVDDNWICRDAKSLIVYPDNFEINNSEIHGIEHQYALESGKPFKDVIKQLEKELDGVNTILAYNAQFDINILLSEAYRYGCTEFIEKFNEKKFICVMKLAREKLKGPYKYQKYKLQNVYNTLFGTEVVQNHRAGEDVEMCSKVFIKLNSM